MRKNLRAMRFSGLVFLFLLFFGFKSYAKYDALEYHLGHVWGMYESEIISYLVGNYSMSEAEALHYYKKVSKLVFRDGLRSKDFYDLFIFKPNTIIPNVLVDVYLRSVLLEEFDIVVKIKENRWYFMSFSKKVGWLKGREYRASHLDEIHLHSVLGTECFSNNSSYHGVIYYINDFVLFEHLAECILVLYKER